MSKKPEHMPAVHLAAFGKHPGWDDHIDDLGVDTDRLAYLKRHLYGEGIAGNIESGAWGRPQEDPPSGLIPFGHVFMWLIGPDVLVGRLWPSRDGKKPPRTNYPMVVCAQLVGLPPEWAVREVLPRLESLESRLSAVESQEEVRAILDAMRQELRGAAAGVSGNAAKWRLDPVKLAKLAERSEVGGGNGSPGVGLLRVLYEVEKEMSDFRPGDPRSWARTRVTSSRGSHLRVPAVADAEIATLGEPMLPWLGLLRAELESAAPMLAIRPVQTDGPAWVDVVAGDPTSSSLQCVRFSTEAVPLTTTVPYNLDPSFVAQCADRFAAWRSGRLPGGDPDGDRDEGESAARPVVTGRSRPRWLWWLGGTGAAVAVVSGVIIASSGGGSNEPAGSREAAAPTGETAGSNVVAASETVNEPEAATAAAVALAAASEPDPRAEWGGSRLLSDLRRRAETLETAGNPAARAELAEVYGATTRVSELVARIEAAPASDMAAVRSLIAQADGQIGDLVAMLDRAEALAAAAPAGTADVAAPSMEDARKRLLARQRIVEASEGANIAWVRWRDELIASATDARDMESAAASLRAGLVRMDEALPKPPRFAGAHADGLLAAARRERDRVFEAQLREARPWRDGDWHEGDGAGSPALAEKATALAAWYKDLINAAAELEEAGSQLAEGFLADEPSAGEGPRARLARWEGKPVLAGLEAEAPAVVRPVQEELARLGRISEAGDIAEVAAALGAGEPTAAAARAAWRRIAELRPTGDVGALPHLVDLSARSMAAISKAGTTARREAWAGEIRRVYVDQCIGTLDRLVDGAAVEAAAAALADLRLEEVDLARLSEPAKYNLALASAKRAAGSLRAASEEAALREQLGGFLIVADGLPAATSSPTAAEFLRGLRDALGAPGPESGALERLGPGSVGWTVEVLDGGDRVRYVWAPSTTTRQAIEFGLVRLNTDPKGPAKLAYLSTEEVSYGLFAGALTSTDGWDLVKPLLRNWDPNLGRDPRQGPRVWDWKSDQRRTPPTRPAEDWLAPGAQAAAAQDKPGESHPMQHVSASAAVLTARLLGCRLPSVEEWRAAVESEGGLEAGASQANRRDAAWQRYIEGAPAANAGVFVPADGAYDRSATSALPADDGAVWFRPVGEGGGRKFKHLFGNVAEMVALQPEEMAKAAATPEGALNAASQVAVVGGSALAPTDLPLDQPLTLGGQAARDGRADLGFRMAFAVPQAPTEPLSVRAGDLVLAAKYLPPNQ